jgi:hypothetical protein
MESGFSCSDWEGELGRKKPGACQVHVPSTYPFSLCSAALQ